MCEILIIITYFIPLVISLIWFIYTILHDVKYDRELSVLVVWVVFCMCIVPVLNVVIVEEAIKDLIEYWR